MFLYILSCSKEDPAFRRDDPLAEISLESLSHRRKNRSLEINDTRAPVLFLYNMFQL